MKNVLGFSLLERFDVNCHILFLVPQVFFYLIDEIQSWFLKQRSITFESKKQGKIKLEFLFVVVL